MKLAILFLATVSAYNFLPSQTDNHPCEMANGENGCISLSLGEKLCASNFFKFGTFLAIKGYGLCRVADRMNKRYGKEYIDIAMMPDEVAEARRWGRQKIDIKIGL